MNSENVIKDQLNKKQKDNFIKQQQQLKAMKATTTSKVLSADSMIEDLLSKKETFQKKKDPSSSNSFSNLQNEPSWLNSDNRSSVHSLYEQIWSMVKLPSVGAVQQQPELADTTIVSMLLMTSGLTTDMLGFIWSLANNTVPGALTQRELYRVLALVALAQSGYVFNSVAVLNQLPHPPIPNLDLSVAVQMKSSFGSVPPTNLQSAMPIQYPVSASTINTIGVSTGESSLNTVSSVNYFTPQIPTAMVPKTTSVNNIMSLDVNNLQSARALTIPNSLCLDFSGTNGASSSLPLASQNLNLSQSTSLSLGQENLNLSSPPHVTGIGPLQNVGILMQPQNSSAVPNQVSSSSVNNAIPSISLGISSPSSSAASIQKTDVRNGVAFAPHVSSAGTSVTSPLNDNVGLSFNQTNMNISGNIITKLSTDLDLSNFEKENIVKNTAGSKIVDSDNVDEIFDSLSTERAMSSTLTSSNSVPVEQYKPNYNINLFDTFSDIKPIFPNISSDSITISNETQVESNNGTIVTHNPIYQNDDIDDNFSYKKSEQKSAGDNIDDDFNDFQSADFNTFNNINCGNVSVTEDSNLKIKESAVKNDEFYDNFTDFQQASSSTLSGTVKITSKSISVDEKSSKDESLFSNSKESFDGFTLNDFSDRLQIVSKDLFNLSNVKDVVNSNNDEVLLSSSSSFNNSRLHSSKTVKERSKDETVDNDNLFDSIRLENNQTGEDKYSALRMLEVDVPSSSSPSDNDNNNKNEGIANDDFGDFISVDPCAEPGQLQLSDVSTSSPVNSIDDTSIQVKCLEACLDVLQKSYDILTSASTPEVLNQVLSDPRGNAHLTCLLEVYKVSERLIQHVESSALVMQVQTVWNSIVPYIDGTKHKQMEETVGPFCSLCKCNYGPSPVRYGLNTYHAPCANLYLHYVNPVLPTVAN